MDEQPDHQGGSIRPERLIERLDAMVESGRVTPEEAQRVRAAADPGRLEYAVRGIRVRHAAAKLREAVEAGQMTQEEADGHLERLRAGEHPRSLRAHLRRLVPRGR